MLEILLAIIGILTILLLVIQLVKMNTTKGKIIPGWKPHSLVGGCSGTRYGCCSDGTTPKKDRVGSNCLLY